MNRLYHGLDYDQHLQPPPLVHAPPSQPSWHAKLEPDVAHLGRQPDRAFRFSSEDEESIVGGLAGVSMPKYSRLEPGGYAGDQDDPLSSDKERYARYASHSPSFANRIIPRI